MEKQYREALSLLNIVHPDSVCLHKSVLPFLIHINHLSQDELGRSTTRYDCNRIIAYSTSQPVSVALGGTIRYFVLHAEQWQR